MTPVRLEPTTPRSLVKHSTTEPMRDQLGDMTLTTCIVTHTLSLLYQSDTIIKVAKFIATILLCEATI